MGEAIHSSNARCPVCHTPGGKPRYKFTWGQVLQCVRCSCAFADGLDFEGANREAFNGCHSDESVELYRQWARERLSALQKFTSAGRLLEFGPGTGEFLYTAAEAGFEVLGVDCFPRLRAKNEHPRVSIQLADARAFRSDAPFEVVAALHVLEHFQEPYTFLSSVRANLVDGGFFLVEVPNYASLSRVVAGARWRCLVSYHALQLTPRSLSVLLKQSGFETASIETVGCSITQLVGLAVPFFGRRLGLPTPAGWEPNGLVRRLATGMEKPFHWGYNLRVVARKI